MKELKVRKTIEVIKGYKRLDECMKNTERLPYCDVAIEALEKQNTKKVREICGALGETVECPECGTGLYDEDVFAGYCKWCGQRIKREE